MTTTMDVWYKLIGDYDSANKVALQGEEADIADFKHAVKAIWSNKLKIVHATELHVFAAGADPVKDSQAP
jgi:hypothetical protein